MDALIYTQGLSHNENSIRANVLRELKKFLCAGKGFSYDVFLKIWKGLYYSLYNSDKSLIQEDLCERIAKLVHILESWPHRRLFIKAAIDTFTREWNGIDVNRLDKYLMLFTRLFRQCLFSLRENDWNQEQVTDFVQMLEGGIICPNDKTHAKPLGLKLHLADILWDEIAKVGRESLSTEVMLSFIKPFVTVLTASRDRRYLQAISEDVFLKLIEQAEVPADEVDEDIPLDPRAGGVDVYLPKLRPDFGRLSAEMQSVGGIKTLSRAKRSYIYGFARRFADAAGIQVPKVNEFEKPKKKKKTRMCADSTHEAVFVESDQNQEDEELNESTVHLNSNFDEMEATLPVKKSKLKGKRKMKLVDGRWKVSEIKAKKKGLKKTTSKASKYSKPLKLTKPKQKGSKNVKCIQEDLPDSLQTGIENFTESLKSKRISTETLGETSGKGVLSSKARRKRVEKSIKKGKLKRQKRCLSDSDQSGDLTPKRKRSLRINLQFNREHTLPNYHSRLRASPAIPFNSKLKPKASVLKSTPK